MNTTRPFADIFETPLKNGLNRPKDVRGVGIPMVNMGEVFAHSRIRNIPMDRVALPERERTFLLRSGDLLFARQSLVLSGAGKCVLFQGNIEETTFESHIIRARLDARIADPVFYFYYFNSPVGRGNVEGIVEQVAAAGIRGSDLARLQVPVPPLPEQRAIAHVLGTLDDKIELNRRMNATLEEMARTLFRSWFVDFEPVKAKELGQVPEGMDADTASLFPDEFEDSEIGTIPKGWKVGTLDLVAQNPRRGTSPRDIEPTTPYVGLEHIPRKSIALYEYGFASEVDSGKFAFEQGEVLFGKLRPYFHKVGLANFNGVCSTDILVISPLKGWLGFVLGHASSVEMIDHATACSDGTRMPRTSWGDIVKYKFALPDESLALRYEREVAPLYQQIGGRIREIQTLSNLRDSLLPKLVSGEVRLSAEMVAEHLNTLAVD